MILVVQFRDDQSEAHERSCFLKHFSKFGDFKFVSAFDKKLPFQRPQDLLENVSHVVLGGCGALYLAEGHEGCDYTKVDQIIKNITPLVKHLIEKDFPTLGICFGHQLIAKVLGATVEFNKNSAESGFSEIKLNKKAKDDKIFAKIPDSFFAVVGHQDSVMNIPKNCVNFASSEKCKIQILKCGENVYSTQFHGELNNEDMAERLRLYPAYKKYANSVKDIKTPSAEKIIDLFLRN